MDIDKKKEKENQNPEAIGWAKKYWIAVLEWFRQKRIIEQARLFLREEIRSLFD